jgi:hypothetical protein
MKHMKYWISFLALMGFAITIDIQAQIGQETRFDRQLRGNDDQPLREFVQSKENIDIREKSKNLEISGDVRFEWQSIHEKGVVLYDPYESSGSPGLRTNYRQLRGGSHVGPDTLPLSYNDFDVEFNLKFKYSFKNAWAMAHLQFDNPAGVNARRICRDDVAVFNKQGSRVVETTPRDRRWSLKGSGESAFINLKRAYIGYNIYADGKERFDIEIGRRKFDDIFFSEIEFANRFDGILLKYASSLGEFSDFYIDLGGFIIDERVNHFGYAMEFGLLNIYDIDLDIRYSLIDWREKGKNRCFIRNPIGTDFLNSQISFTYTIKPTIACHDIPLEFYGGFLINHAAKKTIFTHHKKKNLGWFAGVYIGNVDKKGDWAFDIEYLLVQAQAVPDFDVAGIGRGNILNEALQDVVPGIYSSGYESSSSVPSSYGVAYFPRRGNANFKGWRCEFLYALTDNLSLDLIYETSCEEDRRIGGAHRYANFEAEAVYVF